MDFSVIIIAIAIGVGIFIACRELMCWYYKINKLIELNEASIRNQELIIKILKNSKTQKEDGVKDVETKRPNMFKVDDLVVSIKTGTPMRIKEVKADGIFSCYTEGGKKYEGDFESDQIEIWNPNDRVRHLFDV